MMLNLAPGLHSLFRIRIAELEEENDILKKWQRVSDLSGKHDKRKHLANIDILLAVNLFPPTRNTS